MPATTTQEKNPYILLTSVNVIMVVITLAGFIPTFFSPDFNRWTAVQTAVFLLCGLFYLFMGIYGWDWLIEQKRRYGIFTYFAIQISLVTYIQYVGFDLSGTIWLIIMPIAGQSIILPRWSKVLVPLILIGSFTWTLSLVTPLHSAYNAVVSISVAILFTMIFTYVAARETEARGKIESLAEQLQHANQQLREYAVQVEELATTKERNRLAREIHDSLGHYLTVINVQLSAAQAVLQTDPVKAQDALAKSQKLTQDGLQEIRRSVAALRESPINNRPVVEAITGLAAENREAGIVTEMVVYGEPHGLDPRINLTLYRIAQEGLTNARKHARASRIDVTLDFTQETAVSLTISDNGIGSPQADGGFGLLGLRERVQLLGGSLAVETAVRQGFTLHVTLPTGQFAVSEQPLQETT